MFLSVKRLEGPEIVLDVGGKAHLYFCCITWMLFVGTSCHISLKYHSWRRVWFHLNSKYNWKTNSVGIPNLCRSDFYYPFFLYCEKYVACYWKQHILRLMGIGSELWHYEWQEAHKLNSQPWLMQTEWDFNTTVPSSESEWTNTQGKHSQPFESIR